MKFKDRDEPLYTSDPWYDLFDGGYILPEELLDLPREYNEVREAILLIQQFMEEAQENGILEYT